jgi:short subunit dehydrogenase-like uncharacterized protein
LLSNGRNITENVRKQKERGRQSQSSYGCEEEAKGDVHLRLGVFHKGEHLSNGGERRGFRRLVRILFGFVAAHVSVGKVVRSNSLCYFDPAVYVLLVNNKNIFNNAVVAALIVRTACSRG